MIETKQQVLDSFREKARRFLAEPGFLTGIDLDDASVTLKRYVLTELHDQELGSTLAGLHRMIRQIDTAGVSRLLTEVESRLSD